MRFSELVKVVIKKFDGTVNFGLWQDQVKNILIQSSLHNERKGNVNHSRKS